MAIMSSLLCREARIRYACYNCWLNADMSIHRVSV